MDGRKGKGESIEQRGEEGRRTPLPISSRNCTSSGLKEAIEMDLT